MIKLQYKDTIKKIRISQLNTFSQFENKAKASFKNFTQDPVYYYFDQDGDRIDIDNDDDLQSYKSQGQLVKIYVKAFNDNFVDPNNQSRIISTNSVLTKSVSEDLNSQVKILNSISFNKDSEGESIKKVQKQEKVQKANNTVHKNIKCAHCKEQVVGIRWKCLDQFDADVCNRCYEAKIHKAGHSLLKIQTQDSLSKINYYDTIYRLFNPNYQIDKSSTKVKPWITEEDILQNNPQAVKQIWNASKHIAERVVNEYADWQKQWQKISKKEDKLSIKK